VSDPASRARTAIYSALCRAPTRAPAGGSTAARAEGHPLRAAGAALVIAVVLAGCATSPSGPARAGRDPRVVRVAAAENIWGNLAQQLGGRHAAVTSIINNPDADPHDFEPTAADGRTIATAQLVLINGVGYDGWATTLAAANQLRGQMVRVVGDLVGVRPGGNPHRWYNPSDVRRVVDQITADYTALDPADAGYFDARHDVVVNADLRPYFDLIQQIRDRYSCTRVGASESIFAMMAPALGLDLLTPETFLEAMSEGTDPTARDKAVIDAQIREGQIKVYIYNTQNATPDVRAQVDAARAAAIPVIAITETPVPGGVSFQDWQVAQLTAIERALAEATRR
jgi:zinc/manganese transport system substrate-binding protein